MDKQSEEVLKQLIKCTPEEIIGLAILMQIKTVTSDGNLKDGETIVMEIINTFANMNRIRKRNFMKLLKTTTKSHIAPSAASHEITASEVIDNGPIAKDN